MQVWLPCCHIYCFKQVLLWFGLMCNVCCDTPNKVDMSMDPFSGTTAVWWVKEAKCLSFFFRRHLSEKEEYKERHDVRGREKERYTPPVRVAGWTRHDCASRKLTIKEDLKKDQKLTECNKTYKDDNKWVKGDATTTRRIETASRTCNGFLSQWVPVRGRHVPSDYTHTVNKTVLACPANVWMSIHSACVTINWAVQKDASDRQTYSMVTQPVCCPAS
jgi:hypothetical protein